MYRNDVKNLTVKKKGKMRGVHTFLARCFLKVCLLDNSFSPFELSFAAIGHFVEFGDAVT
jgi:hypothetical protein